MNYQENFKYLNLKVLTKKNAKDLPEDERSFLKLNVLDNNNNPCSFMVFNKDVMKKILEKPLQGLSELSISFELLYSNNNWNVRLVDVIGN